MKERPGVMLYFSNRPCIDALSDEEAGKLIKGFLSYAETGEDPAFDGVLQLLFLMLKPFADFDAERYQRHCTQTRYAVYCRERSKQSLPKLSYEEWKLSADNDSYPNTISISESDSNSESVSVSDSVPDSESESNSQSAAISTAAPSAAVRRYSRFGTGKTVRLTDEDYLSLMEELGLQNLTQTILYAEPKAAELGYDASVLDWKRFLRKCWYEQVRQSTAAAGQRVT